MPRKAALICAALLCLTGLPAAAQEAMLRMGQNTPPRDASAPVEITADRLDLSQGEGTALFTGNVVAVQGALRLSADRVLVTYDGSGAGGPGRVSRVDAAGNVVMVTGAETAEGDAAIYLVDAGLVEMTGNVLLTQGARILAGERLEWRLDEGTGVMSGRVKTIFQGGPAQ